MSAHISGTVYAVAWAGGALARWDCYTCGVADGVGQALGVVPNEGVDCVLIDVHAVGERQGGLLGGVIEGDAGIVNGLIHFLGQLEGETLRSAPKGYYKDHPAIDLLRHKSLVVSHKISDDELVSPKFVNNALLVYKEMQPLLVFLNRAIAEAKPA